MPFPQIFWKSTDYFRPTVAGRVHELHCQSEQAIACYFCCLLKPEECHWNDYSGLPLWRTNLSGKLWCPPVRLRKKWQKCRAVYVQYSWLPLNTSVVLNIKKCSVIITAKFETTFSNNFSFLFKTHDTKYKWCYSNLSKNALASHFSVISMLVPIF